MGCCVSYTFVCEEVGGAGSASRKNRGVDVSGSDISDEASQIVNTRDATTWSSSDGRALRRRRSSRLAKSSDISLSLSAGRRASSIDNNGSISPVSHTNSSPFLDMPDIPAGIAIDFGALSVNTSSLEASFPNIPNTHTHTAHSPAATSDVFPTIGASDITSSSSNSVSVAASAISTLLYSANRAKPLHALRILLPVANRHAAAVAMPRLADAIENALETLSENVAAMQRRDNMHDEDLQVAVITARAHKTLAQLGRSPELHARAGEAALESARVNEPLLLADLRIEKANALLNSNNFVMSIEAALAARDALQNLTLPHALQRRVCRILTEAYLKRDDIQCMPKCEALLNAIVQLETLMDTMSTSAAHNVSRANVYCTRARLVMTYLAHARAEQASNCKCQTARLPRPLAIVADREMNVENALSLATIALKLLPVTKSLLEATGVMRNDNLTTANFSYAHVQTLLLARSVHETIAQILVARFTTNGESTRDRDEALRHVEDALALTTWDHAGGLAFDSLQNQKAQILQLVPKNNDNAQRNCNSISRKSSSNSHSSASAFKACSSSSSWKEEDVASSSSSLGEHKSVFVKKRKSTERVNEVKKQC